MKKIPTLYLRDEATNRRYVCNELHPDCQWVIAGEGVASYKWDGTGVLIDDHYQPWKRREGKPGKTPPQGFRQEGETDPETGKLVGWVPLYPFESENKWHAEALADHMTPSGSIELAPGTYELVGPKILSNPHRWSHHDLIPHGARQLYAVPTGFDDLGPWLHARTEDGFEGIVWHHPDGRMAKIKAKDFPKQTEPYVETKERDGS